MTPTLTVTDAIEPCPFCGTDMHSHDHCFSHPKPKRGDCVLLHYSFGNEKLAAWNTRALSRPSLEPSDAMIEAASLRVAAELDRLGDEADEGKLDNSDEQAFRLSCSKRLAIAALQHGEG